MGCEDFTLVKITKSVFKYFSFIFGMFLAIAEFFCIPVNLKVHNLNPVKFFLTAFLSLAYIFPFSYNF